MKKLNKKGFTMAELLIVVAIIAVLVAIAIPIFTAQLDRSRDATTVANMRAAYAQAQTEMLETGATTSTQSVKVVCTDNDLGEQDDNLSFSVTGSVPNAGDVSVVFTNGTSGTTMAWP